MAENGRLPPEALAPIAQGQLEKTAAAGWNAMNVEARREGLELLPNGSKSSYRTFVQQVELRSLYESGRGNLAAIPGTSNHGTGNAVDLATPAMRTLLDRIGAKYGWSKSWSDAPSEWWHIVYQAGHYTGPDPGPTGAAVEPPAPDIELEEGDMLAAVVKKNGAIEVFVEKSGGQVFHTWQAGENGKWNSGDGGKSISWQSMGTPGGTAPKK